MSSIPTVASSGFFASYIGAFRFLKHGKEIVQEGYDKYRGSIFKMPLLTRWMIIVSRQDKVEDIRRASDDILSFRHVIAEFFRTDLTLGNDLMDDSSHIDVETDRLDIHDSPDTFDGFRFEKKCEDDGESAKHMLASLNCRASPGRFFAANEVKTAIAHILLNYDVKLANDGGRPRTLWLGRAPLPDPTAEVLFQKRT
ncbi:hypothetical protein AX15_006434 [Amanita polypyramis BW_CC]|nr:hypothetical protein AX15_006434 [Amanita polypyramis BW_CC]